MQTSYNTFFTETTTLHLIKNILSVFYRYCFSQKDLSHIALSKVENLSIWAMTRFSLIILCRNYSRINSWAILQSSRNIWQISSSGSTLFSRLALTVTWWYLIIFHSNINFNCGIFFFFWFWCSFKKLSIVWDDLHSLFKTQI